MPNYRFDEVSIKRTVRWVDKDGRKRQKTEKFYQTLNPFNKNKNGSLKTKEQIYGELQIEADNWEIKFKRD